MWKVLEYLEQVIVAAKTHNRIQQKHIMKYHKNTQYILNASKITLIIMLWK